MNEKAKRDILSIIVATSRATENKTPENMRKLAEVLTDAVAPLNPASAFALGAIIAQGGMSTGCPEDVHVLLSVADEIGDQVESVKARLETPKGTLLN